MFALFCLFVLWFICLHTICKCLPLPDVVALIATFGGKASTGVVVVRTNCGVLLGTERGGVTCDVNPLPSLDGVRAAFPRSSPI